MLVMKCLLFVAFLKSVYCLNIFCIFPFQGRSHFFVFEPILKALALKGHNLTVVSYFPQKDKIPGYKDIHLGNVKSTELLPLKFSKYDRFFHNMHMLEEFSKLSCENGFKNPGVLDLINGDDHFDLIITEFFNSECFLGFAYKYKAPVVGLSSCTIMPWTNEYFANPDNPSYIPEILLYKSDKMTFIERLENSVFLWLHKIWYKLYFQPVNDEFARKHFGPDMPSLTTLAKNASLLLVNSHFTLNLPKPKVPAVVEIGGIHLKKPNKLPKNIEKWINESTHGIIYFSMGSMIKGHTFPQEKRQAFLKAFARIPQRILWKWENETLPGQPDNVMIQKWLPQFDILNHPNVKAYIGHGGLLGTIEAVHCGVPLIVMPQFGDQYTNAKAIEANGGGVILDFNEITEENVYNALKTVLDPSFKKQAEELSERFRDRPLPPLETAIYWIEYVARHRGAHHMRTAAVNMPLYQYLLLDVIAFLLVVFLIISFIIFYVIRYLFRLVFPKKPQQKIKKH